MAESTPAASPTRRGFLAATTVAAGGFAAAQVGIARAAHAMGTDEIKIGLVGAGGRGTGAVIQLLSTEGPVRLVAVADAFPHRINECLKQAEREAAKYPQAKVDVPPERQFAGLSAYKQVMETDCDLVVLATPPGFRPVQFEAAVDAKKHVFMEKPVATDAPGVRRVLAAGERAKAQNTAVAVGLQRRHEPRYQEAIKRLQDGAIGDILLTRVYWNSGQLWVRPRQPDQSELQYQVNNWYYFNWVCGDHIVEQHIHNLDVSNWLLGAAPIEAQGQGGRQVRTGKEYGQIFDHHMVEYTYANGAKMLSQCRHMDGCAGDVAEYAHGSKGTADISRGRVFDPAGEPTWRATGRPVQGHLQEQINLVADLRAGRIPNETEYGAHSTMTAILGRMATYSGKRVRWEEAINSDLSLAPDLASWEDRPPVEPDAEGRYPVPTPGRFRAV